MSYAGESGETSAIAVPASEMRSLAYKSGTVGRFVAMRSLMRQVASRDQVTGSSADSDPA
jgi:hypothetical protein